MEKVSNIVLFLIGIDSWSPVVASLGDDMATLIHLGLVLVLFY